MSIPTEINRIENNVANTYSELEQLGADMPDTQNTDNLADTVKTISAVTYKEQNPTEEEKKQARKNIGASGEINVNIGKAKFYGNNNLTLRAIQGEAIVNSSGTDNEGKYTKFATINIAKEWSGSYGTFNILDGESYTFGQFSYYIRTQSAIGTTLGHIHWINLTDARYANSIVIVDEGEGIYSLYFKAPKMYALPRFTLIDCNDRDKITLYSYQQYLDTVEILYQSDILNIASNLDGLTASIDELNYVDGVTSNIQAQLDSKAPINNPEFTGGISFYLGKTGETGANSVSFGWQCAATAFATLAGGNNSNATANYAAAWGEHLNADYQSQTVVGTYNDNKSENLFEVGNGLSDTSRNNAFEVTKNGDVVANGVNLNKALNRFVKCTTPNGTFPKVIEKEGFVLEDGAELIVTFTQGESSGSLLRLQINDSTTEIYVDEWRDDSGFGANWYGVTKVTSTYYHLIYDAYSRTFRVLDTYPKLRTL